MITFYEYPKCTTCRRAKAELETLVSTYQAINIKENPPKAQTILKWFQTSTLDRKAFFNTSGQRYRELGLKDKLANMSDHEAAELLASDGMLIKRPILLQNDQLLQIGYRRDYKTLGL